MVANMSVALQTEQTQQHLRKLWTREEAARLAELFPLEHYELIEGELILVAAPPPKHQRVSGRLFRWFGDFLMPRDLGEVLYAPLDVRLGPESYVQPDLLVILRERAHLVGPHLVDGAPDLVVEIFSPSSRSIDQDRKLRLYARTGVRETWLVDIDAGVDARADGVAVPQHLADLRQGHSGADHAAGQ